MNAAEEPLQKGALEDSIHQFIHTVSPSQAISVSHTDSHSIQSNGVGLLKNLNPHLLLQKGVGPDIVIAVKEKELHTPVRQRGKSAQCSGIASRNYSYQKSNISPSR